MATSSTSAVLARVRVPCTPIGAAAALVLFAGSTSSGVAVTEAVFVSTPRATGSTAAEMTRVAVPSTASSPTAQVMVPVSSEQSAGSTGSVTPAGSGSVSTTSGATAGPALPTSMVHSTVPPATGGPLTDLTTERSAAATTVATAWAVLFSGSASSGLVADAALVS